MARSPLREINYLPAYNKEQTERKRRNIKRHPIIQEVQDQLADENQNKHKRHIHNKTHARNEQDQQAFEHEKQLEQQVLAEQKAVNDSIRQSEIDKLDSAFDARQSFRESIIGRALPDIQHKGSLGNMMHLAEISAEGVEAAILMGYLFLIVEILFATHYYEGKEAFVKAFGQEFEAIYDLGPEKFTAAYVKNEHGHYPPVYPMKANNKPDHSKPRLQGHQITEELIYLNGYTPVSSRELQMALASFMVNSSGVSHLTMLDKLKLYGKPDLTSQGRDEQNDAASDLLAQRNMAPRPAVKIGK